MSNTASELEQGTSDHLSAVFAGFLGWTLDAFDYFILTLCVPAIAKTFAVDDSKIYLTIWLTLLARPVGAFLFGLLADRYGRRRPMMINLIFYSCMSVCSGLAPNYTIFLVCRILFGIGMGGEWGVGASLAMEKVPPKLRGLLSGLLQEGYAFGLLLATAGRFFVLPLVHNDWRPLFWIGGLPALLAIFIRMHVKESEVWQKTKKGNWSNLGSAVISHWPVFVSMVVLMFMMNLASHGTQDIFPKLLKNVLHLSPGTQDAVVAVSCLGMISGGLVVGLISDRIGRRKAMVVSLLLATLPIPLWAFAPNLWLLMVGVFLIQFFVQGAWGVIPAHLSELSPDSVRGLLPGFAYQCGVAFAGCISYFENALSARMTLNAAMAITALTVFPLAALVVGIGKESKGLVFGQKSTTD